MGCHPSHWRTHIFQDGFLLTTNQLWFMVEVNGNSKPTNITGGTLPCRIEKGQFASIPLYRIDCSIFLIFLEVAIGRVLKSWIFFMWIEKNWFWGSLGFHMDPSNHVSIWTKRLRVVILEAAHLQEWTDILLQGFCEANISMGISGS